MAKRRKLSSSACAACRMQRKKCSEKCVFAPYFPSDDPDKFAMVHSVFGTSRIVKIIEGVEAEQRADAVNSMVYEATARVADPVHGCVTTIHQMQRQIAELETQLAATEEDLRNIRSQYDKQHAFLPGTDTGTGSQDAQWLPYPTDSESENVDPLLL